MNVHVFAFSLGLMLILVLLFSKPILFPKLIFLINNSDGNQYIVAQQPQQSPDYIFCPYPVQIENFNVKSHPIERYSLPKNWVENAVDCSGTFQGDFYVVLGTNITLLVGQFPKNSPIKCNGKDYFFTDFQVEKIEKDELLNFPNLIACQN